MVKVAAGTLVAFVLAALCGWVFAGNPDAYFAQGSAVQWLSAGVTKLIALAESYPDLKANENFLNLQNELVETENYLQFARRYYNGSVRDFNIMTETVPSNIIAGIFGFSGREFFQKSSDDVANVPLAKFGSVE